MRPSRNSLFAMRAAADANSAAAAFPAPPISPRAADFPAAVPHSARRTPRGGRNAGPPAARTSGVGLFTVSHFPKIPRRARRRLPRGRRLGAPQEFARGFFFGGGRLNARGEMARLLTTVHINIGMLYFEFSLLLGGLAFFHSALFRMELSSIGPLVLFGDGHFYNSLVTAHGLIIVFGFIINVIIKK